MTLFKENVVIGGGIAGISCLSLLCETSPTNTMLIERERLVGGNVRTSTVGRTEVDIGSLEVFPWYYYFRKLLEKYGENVEYRDKWRFGQVRSVIEDLESPEGSSYRVREPDEVRKITIRNVINHTYLKSQGCWTV